MARGRTRIGRGPTGDTEGRTSNGECRDGKSRAAASDDAAARARRSGSVAEVDSTRLVPSDIVLVEAGDLDPADGRAHPLH